MRKILTSLFILTILLTVTACNIDIKKKSEQPDNGSGNISASDNSRTSEVEGNDETDISEVLTEETEETKETDFPDVTDSAVDNSQTEISVMTQEYEGDNIAEILMIRYDGQQPVFEQYNWKNPEIEALDLTIKSGIQQIYNDFMNDRGESWIEIKSYPFTSDDWLQIVTTWNIYPTYGTDGDMESYNFNKKQNRYVTVDDAMNDFGLTKDVIAQKAKELYVPDYPSKYIKEIEPKGFLICQGAEGPYTMFLLEVLTDNPDAGEWKNFFAYIPQLNEFYQLNGNCLFDPYDMDQMDPPLSYQSYQKLSGNEWGALDEAGANDFLLEVLATSGKIAEMEANVAQGNSIALVSHGEEVVNGNDCYTFALGTNTIDKFTAEEYYAVSKTGGMVYYMDIINGGEYVEYGGHGDIIEDGPAVG